MDGVGNRLPPQPARKEIDLSTYASTVGFVQFDPQTREVNGKSLEEFTIRAIGFQGQPLLKVTVWPELQNQTTSEIRKGSFVAVDGKYQQNTAGDGKTYHNLSATGLSVDGVTVYPVPRASAGVTNAVANESTQAPF